MSKEITTNVQVIVELKTGCTKITYQTIKDKVQASIDAAFREGDIRKTVVKVYMLHSDMPDNAFHCCVSIHANCSMRSGARFFSSTSKSNLTAGRGNISSSDKCKQQILAALGNMTLMPIEHMVGDNKRSVRTQGKSADLEALVDRHNAAEGEILEYTPYDVDVSINISTSHVARVDTLIYDILTDDQFIGIEGSMPNSVRHALKNNGVACGKIWLHAITADKDLPAGAVVATVDLHNGKYLHIKGLLPEIESDASITDWFTTEIKKAKLVEKIEDEQ